MELLLGTQETELYIMLYKYHLPTAGTYFPVPSPLKKTLSRASIFLSLCKYPVSMYGIIFHLVSECCRYYFVVTGSSCYPKRNLLSILYPGIYLWLGGISSRRNVRQSPAFPRWRSGTTAPAATPTRARYPNSAPPDLAIRRAVLRNRNRRNRNFLP